MKKIEQILGFIKMMSLKITSMPLAVILKQEDGGHEIVYPGGGRKKVYSILGEEDLRASDFFIPSDKEKLIWKDGQTAYLDHAGVVHVGTALETIEVIKKDLMKVKDVDHRKGLNMIIQTLKEEVVIPPS